MSKNKFSVLASLLLIVVASGISSCSSTAKMAKQQNAETYLSEIPDGPRARALRTILPTYTDWQTAELNGKIRMKGLPLSPSLKIYMTKKTAVTISVRAPILGEVGRIEIDGDSVLAINKMKNVYCRESIAGIKYEYPDAIADLQSLLLGRVVVVRSGELSVTNSDYMDFTETEQNWSLTYPKGRSEYDEFGYEYKVNREGRIDSFIVSMSTADRDLAAQIDYSYPGNNMNLDISATQDSEKKFSTEIDFDQPRYGVTMPSPAQLNSRAKRVGIKEFIKSF